MMIKPDWPAPPHVKAYTTVRCTKGASIAPFDHFNLATHVGDANHHVVENRRILRQTLALPQEPVWLKQTHSTIAVPALSMHQDREADATYTNQTNQVCAILTADCLPILLYNQTNQTVAAIHAGWRGLAHGIIQQTLNAITAKENNIMVWLGPAISQKHYEVGDPVRTTFITLNPDNEAAFIQSKPNHWHCDLYTLARIQLKQHQITAIFGGDRCTYAEKESFYSYRRDGAQTGRMASLIWISE